MSAEEGCTPLLITAGAPRTAWLSFPQENGSGRGVMMRSLAMALAVTGALASAAFAQSASPMIPSPIFRAPPENVTLPTARIPARPGLAPGLKATELSPNVRTFRLVFARGDDVLQGLAEFAEKNHLSSSRFTAIGAFSSATIGLT